MEEATNLEGIYKIFLLKSINSKDGIKIRNMSDQDELRLREEKRPEIIYRPLKSLICSEIILPTSGEQFNVLLRTCASSRRSNNGLHGGTSISSTSPPFNSIKLILRIFTLFVKHKYHFYCPFFTFIFTFLKFLPLTCTA